MAGFENDVLLCTNVNFNPALPKPHPGLITTDGQLIIGSTVLNAGGTHISIGSITSPGGTISVGYSTPNIVLSAGSTLATTYTTNSGNAVPAANVLNVLGSGSITTTGSGNTVSTVLSGLTNHAVLVGAGTSTITKVGPTATAGQVFQSAGASADPVFSTATFPSTATATGTILRADGTNWVATTATYPASTTANQILYSTANNVVGELATAASGVLTTSSGSVPSIDTTNFHVLSTGVQTKGNNTNTAPPAGFIGEQIRATLGSGSATALVSNTAKTVTSISLTAGIWDISGIVSFIPTVNATVTQQIASISATTNALGGANGDDTAIWNYLVAITGIGATIAVPSLRVTLAGTTSYFLVAQSTFAVNTMSAYGRISATRVG